MAAELELESTCNQNASCCFFALNWSDKCSEGRKEHVCLLSCSVGFYCNILMQRNLSNARLSHWFFRTRSVELALCFAGTRWAWFKNVDFSCSTCWIASVTTNQRTRVMSYERSQSLDLQYSPHKSVICVVYDLAWRTHIVFRQLTQETKMIWRRR